MDCKLQPWDTTTFLVKCPQSKILITPNAGEDVEKQEFSLSAGSNEKWKTFLKIVWWFLTKLNIFTFDLAISLLGICPDELKIYVHIKTCPHTFTAVLFVSAKNWKQPTCPSVSEVKDNLWYIHTV